MGFFDKLVKNIPIISAITDIGSAIGGHSAQKAANKQNLKMAREQRDWEANMANTAVQRRKADVEAAGFNPLLAVTGPGAATPSVGAPTAEPTFRPEWTKGSATQALMTKAQLENLQASTALTSEKARQEKEVADWMTSKDPDAPNTSRYRIERVAKLVKTKMEALLAENQVDMSAAQLEQFRRATNAVVATIQQQADRGKIDLDAIKAVIEDFGLGAQQKANLLQSLMKLIVPLIGNKD